VSAGRSASSTPLDAVSLNFAKIDVEYKEQMANGQLGAVV
jgi:type VI protein secretion system component Hcp